MIVPGQAATQYTEDDLAILAAAIRSEGLREPLLVRPLLSDPVHFEVIVGDRRLQACDRAELVEIPCLVSEITNEGRAAARAEYKTKRARWVIFFPVLRKAMLDKIGKVKKLSPALFQKTAIESGLPKKIRPAEFAPALAAQKVRDEINRATAENYFIAEARLAPWAKALGINLKALEREAKK